MQAGNKKISILSIIPARGGSKRLPGKNIKDLCGKPLIAWTIEASLKSKYIEKTIVSTDCEKIAEVGKMYGAEVPFIRPGDLASDVSATVDAVLHALNFYKENGFEFTHVLLLQPTSPLRTATDIENSIKELIDRQANAIYSVCEVDHSPLWSNTLPDDKNFDSFLKEEVVGKRSQDLPKYYRLNGAIYLVEVSRLIKQGALHNIKPGYAYIMDRKSSIDIDEEIDFIVADYLLKSNLNEIQKN